MLNIHITLHEWRANWQFAGLTIPRPIDWPESIKQAYIEFSGLIMSVLIKSINVHKRGLQSKYIVEV